MIIYVYIYIYIYRIILVLLLYVPIISMYMYLYYYYVTGYTCITMFAVIIVELQCIPVLIVVTVWLVNMFNPA